MTELLASYATDRYVVRLMEIEAYDGQPMLLLQTESQSGSSFHAGIEWALYYQTVEACIQAEENYWRSLMSKAPPKFRALTLSGWEHFRAYAGLPAPNPEEITRGNDQQEDGRGSDGGAPSSAEPEHH